MTTHRDHDETRDSRENLGRLFEGLSTDARATATPDQTRAIMGRLGYMRAAPAVAARRRRLRLAGRAAALVLMAGAALVAVRMHDILGESRLPSGPTLEDAFRDEIDRRRGMFDGAARTIRNLVPQANPASPSPGEPPSPWDDPRLLEDLERSGIGPFRWL